MNPIRELDLLQTKAHLMDRYCGWPQEEEKTGRTQRFTRQIKQNLRNLLPSKAKPFRLDIPLDVWSCIVSHLSCHDKAQFRAVCKTACRVIDTRSSFWIEVERNLIAREFPPTLLLALGGVDAVHRLPAGRCFHYPDDRFRWPFSYPFCRRGD